MAPSTSRTRNGESRRIRDVPHELVQYLHPSLRPTALRHRRRLRAHRDLAVRIRNRYLKYGPKPRVFPWYCETCTLSSRHLNMIVNHDCRQKSASSHLLDFANEQRIAQLGFRSKARDALAVMERIGNPQHIDLHTIEFVGRPSILPIQRVPTLGDLCLASVAYAGKDDAVRTSDYYVTSADVSEKHPFARLTPDSHLCHGCQTVFPTYADYDDHFDPKQYKCTSKNVFHDETVIDMMELAETTSCDAETRGRRHRPVKRNVSRLQCTVCGAGKFQSPDALYSHMVKCAVAQFQPGK